LDECKPLVIGSPLFDRLRERHGDGFQVFVDQRLVPIAGDLGAEGLGLSPEDEASIVAEAEVVVNSAATTAFDERFDTAVNVNTLGPRRLLRLSRKCPNLMLMCHVSTAFVNGLRRGPVQERAFSMGDCIARELSPDGEGPVLNPYAEVALALTTGRVAAGEVSAEVHAGVTSAVAAGARASRVGAVSSGGTSGWGNRGNEGDVGRPGETGEPPSSSTLDLDAQAQLVRLGSQRARLHGRPVQLDPIKLTLKAPGTKRWKLKCGKLL
jgi:hypothetical protein